MLINIQDSAYKDLKKIDKKEAIKILQTIKKLEDYPPDFVAGSPKAF